MAGPSKKKSDDPNPLANQYMADLTSYEAAVQTDPDLRAFDHTLHQRTTRVINSLAIGVEVRSLSFDSLREVTNSLLEMNQEVVKVILDCKNDIWNDPNLFALVEDYFDNSLQTLDFCTSLDKCLKRARDSQLIVEFAIRRFDDEEEGSSKYGKTLEELEKFKACGDPFTEDFFALFQSVYKQQLVMLEKLQIRKRKLDKKLKSSKVWIRVSNVIFGAAFVSALIFSVVAAAIAAPPLITAIAGALTVPIGSVGKWCGTLLKKYQTAIKNQRELTVTMQVGTFVVIKDMDSIRLLVNKLQVEIQNLMQSADFALGSGEADVAARFAVEEMRRKLGVFMETVDDLGKHADKCSREIRMARTVVLQRMIKNPNNGG